MICIGTEHIAFSHGEETILKDITFQLNDGEKLGIVGVNGAGKSTLFHILSGNLVQSAGAVIRPKNHRIGLLTQNDAVTSENSIYDEMLLAFDDLLRDEIRLRELEEEIEGCPVKQGAAYEKLVASYSALSERFRENGGLTFRNRTGAMLRHMGFAEDTWNIRISSLSGGQKTRLALIRLLLQEPDILMLDEPTNHLDLNTLTWLERFLVKYKKTLLVISHDRYFLDAVTTKTLEIEFGICFCYNGGYTAYLNQKEENRKIEEKHYQNQQKEIKRIEAYIAQQKRWNRERNIIAAESRQKMLDRMDKLEKPKNAPKSINFKFSEAEVSGFDVLTLDNLSKSYGQRTLFDHLNAEVKKKDRIFVCGPNGCGKSTLLKIITGKLSPDSGECLFGRHIQLGYYDQEQQALNEENTVIEELWQDYERLTQTEIRNALSMFRFQSEDMEKKVRVLSGGEKARLTLAKLVLSDYNLLVLDEPTNHLDIPSREALENALLQFDGTLIAVSHDRYFIQKLATRIFDLSNGLFCDFKDTYDRYLTWKEQAECDAEQPTKRDEAPVSDGKQQYLQNKQSAAERRKNERQLAKTKEEIPRLEHRLEEIETEISGNAATDYIRLSELAAEKEQVEETLLQLYEAEETLTALLS